MAIVLIMGMAGCTSIPQPNPYQYEKAIVTPTTFMAEGAQIPIKPPGKLRLSVLPVGAGNCVIMELPIINGKTPFIINDCGSSGAGTTGWSKADTVDFINQLLDQYIVNNNFTAHVIVVVSHADIDHYNILPSLNTNMVAEVYLGGLDVDYNDAMKEWVGRVQNLVGQTNIHHDLRKTLVDEIRGYQVGPYGVSFKMLTVNASTSMVDNDDKNADSIVTRLDVGEISITNTGDATADTILSALRNVSERGWELKTDILVSPHHGAESHGSNSYLVGQAFLPQMVIFSAGDRYLHPRCTSLEAYYPTKQLLNRIANYVPRVTQVAPHQVRCGRDNQYHYKQTDRNVWVTSATGLIQHTW